MPNDDSARLESRHPKTKSKNWRYAKALFASLLPGLLAGTQVAGILFFLNPHLSFDALTILKAVGFYGTLLGGTSLLILTVLTGGRLKLARRWLPASLTIVLLASATIYWIHAYFFGFFLPPGINIRLLKAAISLSLAALICFYTIIIHKFRRRPYGSRSRALFFLMALASFYVVVERREAYRPDNEPSPRQTLVEDSSRPKLAVIGIDAATLDAILPLAEQGRLPFLSQMMSEGAQARLSTLSPNRRAALWTTLATGKYPYKHGIVGERITNSYFGQPGKKRGYLDLLPVAMGFRYWGTWASSRPIHRHDMRVKPLWQVFSRLGISTALIGWPVTAPPSDDVDIVLADQFFEQHAQEEGAQDTYVKPAEMADRARLFRSQAQEVNSSAASRFGSEPPEDVLSALAQDQWRQDLAFFLLDHEPSLEALFLLLPGLGEVSKNYFGGYHETQFQGTEDAESVEAAGLLSAYYTYLDEFLAQFWLSMPEPRLLVVVSAHGVYGSQGWKEFQRSLLRRPAMKGYFDGAPDGVLFLLGEGVRREAVVRDAQLVDLVPSLLYGVGLPVARDSDGGVLTGAFDTNYMARRPLTFVPSYETLATSKKP